MDCKKWTRAFHQTQERTCPGPNIDRTHDRTLWYTCIYCFLAMRRILVFFIAKTAGPSHLPLRVSPKEKIQNSEGLWSPPQGRDLEVGKIMYPKITTLMSKKLKIMYIFQKIMY